MKPRSAREREVMKLHGKLPPISERQIRYAKENCFPKVGYITKGKVWCTMCGKVFEKKAPELGVSLGIEKKDKCPFCGMNIGTMDEPCIADIEACGLCYKSMRSDNKSVIFKRIDHEEAEV